MNSAHDNTLLLKPYYLLHGEDCWKDSNMSKTRSVAWRGRAASEVRQAGRSTGLHLMVPLPLLELDCPTCLHPKGS